MEQKIKIIKLIESSKISTKKQLYNDILSSSKKVQDIIKKTKINKNKYYRTKNEYKGQKIEFNEPKIEFNEPKIFEPKIEFNEPKIEFNEIKSPKIFEPKKTKCNKQHFITFNKIHKKTLKQIPNSKYKSKKINSNCVPSLKYVNSKQQTIRLFTNNEINKFIDVLTYYGEYEQFKNIHKYIKKLNNYQTNQILQYLNLINRKSKAPIKMLKNILYNYFCCNLIISR
jgi:hypothetical protein